MYIVKRQNTRDNAEQYFSQSMNSSVTVLSFTVDVNKATTLKTVEQAKGVISCSLNKDRLQGRYGYTYNIIEQKIK